MIWLKPAQVAVLEAYASSDATQEVCGVLFGRDAEVIDIVPVPNTDPEPHHRFRLDEGIFVKAIFEAEKRGLSLVGFYHSHPTGLAMPSQTDIDQAHYPDAVHLIIGLAGVPRLAAWRLAYGRAEPVMLHVGADPANGEASPDKRLETVAIVASTVTALIVLILLSLVLLPPAPALPAP